MSEHCGYVVRVEKLRPHTNADKLQIATFFGNDTCVSLDTKFDEIGIYFPSDLQLSEEFCVENHLCRKKPDGTPDTGYLEPDKRNIKAIKLRGEKSDGIFMPLSCLVYTGVNLDDINVGDTITVVNGHEICKKYIPRGRNKINSAKGKGNKTRKKHVPIAPLFTEHADTEQLAYNLGAFQPGDQIEITLKMHGCFIKGTKVRMADNSLKSIENIKPGDYVLGYNFNSKKIEPTKVIHTFKNAPSNKWNELKFSREYIKGDKKGTQISTYNHKYWVEERQKWVMAQDLKVGDVVSTLFPSPILTSLQKEVAIGSFLGDGCLLSFGNKTAEIQETKKKDHIEYLDFLTKLTSGWFTAKTEKISGYNNEVVAGRTVRSADLYNYFKDISTFKNVENERRLLEGIVDKITPLSIALWYCGDGSLAHNDKQDDRALLAICRYTQEEDRAIIEKIFKRFNIYPVFYLDADGYWRLRFNLEEANKLFNLICSYIPDCMQYKLPENYRNKFIMPVENEEYQENGYVLSPQIILENNVINKMMDEYDLETEFHNYVVGMTIVHNTSQRTGYLPVLKGYRATNCLYQYALNAMLSGKDIGSWTRKIAERALESATPIYDWGYVSGTRRTVLDDWDGGFYGSNAFRKQHHDVFVGKLHKGEEVYYEVVGFTDNGTSIMGKGNNKKLGKDFVKQYGEETVFSYGCSPTGKGYGLREEYFNGDIEGGIVAVKEVPQSDIYVYRMTMTNEDGDVVEYSPDFMRYRCEQMGVKCVPLFSKVYVLKNAVVAHNTDGTVSGGNLSHGITIGEAVKDIAEQFYDGTDPVGKTHVREGVVVRIINRPKFCAYKHKNYSFKMLEGLIKETAEAPDMEEAEEVNK